MPQSSSPRSRSAFAHSDLLGVVFGGLLLCSLLSAWGPLSDRDQLLARSTQNLKLIADAGHLYQSANNNYLPIVLSYRRGFTNRPGLSGSLEGWCAWSFGGKNNSSFWASMSFDVEAADRPLNSYTNPGQVFYAPAPPARLPANDRARLKDQAGVYQDPSDKYTTQRSWPNPTYSITTYNDVGTSYLYNASWFSFITNPPGFEAQFNEGTRRISVGQGVVPSRFVWVSDANADVVINQSNRAFRLLNGYGEYNSSLLGFIDGHVAYHKLFPGPSPARYRSSAYSFIFE